MDEGALFRGGQAGPVGFEWNLASLDRPVESKGSPRSALLAVRGCYADFAYPVEDLCRGPEAGGVDSVVVGQQDFQGNVSWLAFPVPADYSRRDGVRRCACPGLAGNL